MHNLPCVSPFSSVTSTSMDLLGCCLLCVFAGHADAGQRLGKVVIHLCPSHEFPGEKGAA